MVITVEQLVAAGISPTHAHVFAEPLTQACTRFRIDTSMRVGAFLAQCMVQSSRFEQLEENVFATFDERIKAQLPQPSPTLLALARLAHDPQALANRMYAEENGNRDEDSGDGWKYRGRGLIRLIGRENYADAARALNAPYLDEPDLVAQPIDACLTAAWFWHSAKLNLLADAALVDAITWRVSGRTMLDAGLRRQLSENAAKAFG